MAAVAAPQRTLEGPGYEGGEVGGRYGWVLGRPRQVDARRGFVEVDCAVWGFVVVVVRGGGGRGGRGGGGGGGGPGEAVDFPF